MIDLDIILWSGGSWASETLIVPHRLYRARDFVLRPLAAHPSCAGLGLACYNPEKDPDRASARAIIDLTRAVLGD